MTSSREYVTAIGGANIDINGRSQQELKRNDSNPGNVHLSAGGVARNVAENLARLGVDCRLITAVGNDHLGQILQQLSNDAGIDTKYVSEIPSRSTSAYLSVLDNSGDMLVGINDMSIIDQLDEELLQTHQAMLEQSSLVVIDCNLSDDALGWLAKSLGDTPIFADTVSTAKATRLKPYLHAIHTLKTSTTEVEALTGHDARTQDQLKGVAEHLHSKGVERVFVTRGEDGVFYSSKDDQDVRKLNRDQPIDNAGGAGDAFLAGVAYGWLNDWSLEDSTQFALAVADITMSHQATSSPDLSVAAVNRLLEIRRAH